MFSRCSIVVAAAVSSALCAFSVLAAPQDPVKERLDNSPRHHEWVNVKAADRSIRCFIVFPEVEEKATAVLVIHENKGLTDWVRSVADQLAEHGYIAIAPDMLSGRGPGGGNTDGFESVDAATQGIYALDADEVQRSLNAVAEYVVDLDASNGVLTVGGFCWGGSQTFRFATANPRDDLAAAFVFYGSAPTDREELANIKCPVYGFYGGNDARINSGIPATDAVMKELGKTYEPVIYKGAGHGFMRAGELPDASAENKKALEEGWARWKELLGGLAAEDAGEVDRYDVTTASAARTETVEGEDAMAMATAPAPSKTPAVGSPAPDFTLKTQDDKDWKLSDQRGNRVVLMWYPLDWSPTCEKENCRIGQDVQLEGMGDDTVVVGISRDSTWSHRAFKADRNIEHDLLADPMLEVTKKFGLVHPAGFISHRATVIIDRDGNVAWVQIQENTKEERDWNAVKAALAKVK